MLLSTENILTEYKSILAVKDEASLRKLSVTCVSFANAQGGRIVVSIEDKDGKPPTSQIILTKLINKVITTLRTLCFNVELAAGEIENHLNGGQYFIITIHPSLKSIATTSDGKIYIRIGDQCQAARSEDIYLFLVKKMLFSGNCNQEMTYL